jgi:hypothetical protein
MPDLQRLWDSFLADEERFRYLFYVCVAVILSQKDELVRSDFSEIMMKLQATEQLDL